MREGNTKDLLVTKPILSIFVYGPWGSGKTWFACSAPKVGYMCVEREPRNPEILKKAIPYRILETWDEYTRTLDDIIAGKLWVDRETIVLDSQSDLSTLVAKAVFERSKSKDYNQDIWGKIADEHRKALRKLAVTIPNILGKHVIVTSRSKTKDDANGNLLFGMPEITGQFATSAPGMFDIVLYSEQSATSVGGKEQKLWNLHTVEHGKFRAKDTYGALSAKEPNDFMAIYDKVAKVLTSHA